MQERRKQYETSILQAQQNCLPASSYSVPSFCSGQKSGNTFYELNTLSGLHTDNLCSLYSGGRYRDHPDFINAEETFYASHAVVLNRSTTRRLTNTKADLTCHEAAGYCAFCILLSLMLFYLAAAFLCSRQFIIRYIHDQDGQKNKLLYF